MSGKITQEGIDMVEFCDIIEKELDTVNIILEVGSLHGKDAMYIRSRFPMTQTYIIEGSKINFQENDLASLNTLTNVFVFNIIIAEEEKDVTYHQKGGAGRSGLFQSGGETRDTWNTQATTLKLFFQENNIQDIDVMKLDVEGASYEALVGMGEYLQKTKIIHIELEERQRFVNQKHLAEESRQLLLQNNFRLLLSRAVNARAIQYDEIWINEVKI